MRQLPGRRDRDRRRSDGLHDALGVRRAVRRRRQCARRPSHAASAATCWRATPGREPERLDLFADVGRIADAIGDFAGRAEAARLPRRSAPRAARVYRHARAAVHPCRATDARCRWLRGSACAASPTCWRHLALRHAVAARSASISATRGCASCSAATRPTAARRRSIAPATLMLIAHVERRGRLAGRRRDATGWSRRWRDLAARHGAVLRCGDDR